MRLIGTVTRSHEHNVQIQLIAYPLSIFYWEWLVLSITFYIFFATYWVVCVQLTHPNSNDKEDKIVLYHHIILSFSLLLTVILFRCCGSEVLIPPYYVIASYRSRESMMASRNGNIFRVTGHLCGEFTGDRWPHKGQWRGALMFSLICARINVWVNNREAGELRRHRVHYDVIVMTGFCFYDHCTAWCVKIIGYIMTRRWYSFVCTQPYRIIIIVQSCLNALNI